MFPFSLPTLYSAPLNKTSRFPKGIYQLFSQISTHAHFFPILPQSIIFLCPNFYFYVDFQILSS